MCLCIYYFVNKYARKDIQLFFPDIFNAMKPPLQIAKMHVYTCIYTKEETRGL